MATATTTTASAAATSANRVSPQGGILEGANPSKYDPSNPLTIFIIQAGLIIIICHILHWPLSKIRQPRVIAEVLGGIVLGPSVMGHIPGFTQAIFPTASIPNLTLVANLGLVLYLFMIGLETDLRFLISNWRIATSVTFCGLALPFGIGCGLAWGIYNAFRSNPGIVPIQFSVYMLFVGIATAITAFPVLCRILTELKLLDTSVGIITLSAGVANDVVGWILLALCVALVNAGNGLTALWILLICFGYILLLFFAVKPALHWLMHKTDNIKNGPSQSAISLILLMALASAFFTGIIGIHPIFGGFIVGLIVPREHRFSIHVIEKLEDLVGAVFLPLYFTLSGLSTNLGLLNTGTAWGYVFATTFVALFTKIIGASVAARLNGLVWRESLTIGALMSCKGLVELIVLNIGLQAEILSTRTFTIFVVMALLTTFATTPMVSVLYPPWYQKKIEAWKRGEIDWDTGAPISPSDSSTDGTKPTARVNRMLVYLRLDNMPALLGLLSLFGSSQTSVAQASVSEDDSKKSSHDEQPKPVVRAHGIRLLELTDRDSSVVTVAQVDEYSRHDPIVNTFRTVGQLHNIAASGEVAIMPEDRFAEALVTRSSNMSSDLLVVPWSETGSIGDSQILSSANVDDKLASTYLSFVKSVLASTEQNIGVFFTRSTGDAVGGKDRSQERAKLVRAYSYDVSKREFPTAPLTTRLHHIFLAYFGDSDDKLALTLVLQLCEKARVTATIVRVSESAGSSSSGDDSFDTVWARVPADVASRIKIEKLSDPVTVEDILHYADSVSDANTSDARKPSLVVLGRRTGARLDGGKLTLRLKEDVQSCLGVVAGHFVASGVTADLLVVQAKSEAVSA